MGPVLQVLLAAVGSFIGVTLVFSLILFICRRVRKRGRRTIHPPSLDRYNSSSALGSVSFDPSIRPISFADLAAVTRDFAPEGIIGDGSFGFVYKAQLPDGPIVAVKKLDRYAFQGFREFRAEVETLGRIRHENLVKILGYSISGADRLLIYEFIEFGSLDQWLHDSSPHRSEILAWRTRVNIMLGVATGLEYLHNKCVPRIIHRDIKASNVLLDSEFRPHIADFGLARKVNPTKSHVSTQVAGTVGYMPPEYMDGVTGATVKADVYSFGVLMLEVATGKRPHLTVRVAGGNEVWLTPWAHRMVHEGKWMEMIDASINLADTDESQVKEVLRIACLCTSEAPKARPNTQEVVELLRKV